MHLHTRARAHVSTLQGLVTTLALLAIARKPLPALPVSMVLGVAAYLVGRFLVDPMLVQSGNLLVGL